MTTRTRGFKLKSFPTFSMFRVIKVITMDLCIFDKSKTQVSQEVIFKRYAVSALG